MRIDSAPLRKALPGIRRYQSEKGRKWASSDILQRYYFHRTSTRESEKNLLISTRQLSRETGIPPSSVVRCLKELQLYPFKFSLVQELSKDDYDRRVEFSHWICAQRNERSFHRRMAFSDEAVFHVNGLVNRRNLRYWSQQNPHVKIEKFQNRESITI